MKKEFYINIALLLFINLLIKPIYLFGIDKNIQLIVGQEQYGIYYNILSFTLILQFINDLGLQNYTNRTISQDRNNWKDKVNELGMVKLILAIIYIIFTLVIAFFWNYDPQYYPLIFQLCLNQILIGGIFFNRAQISGLGHYRVDSILSSLDRFILIVVGGLFLSIPAWRNVINITWFVHIQTLSLLVCFIISLSYLVIQKLNIKFYIPSYTVIKNVVITCLPFTMIYLFNVLYAKQDNLLLGKLVEDGEMQNGIYAASMRLFEAGNMVSLAFGSLLLGMFSSVHLDKQKLAELFSTATTLLCLFAVGLSFISFFYASWINEFIYHQNNLYWDKILSTTMLAFLPASLTYIFGAYYQAMHQEKKLYIIYAVIAIFNFVLNLFFIPQLKSEGAAISNLSSQTLLLILLGLFSNKNIFEQSNYKIYGRILYFIILSFGICYFIKYHLPYSDLIQILCSAISILTIALMFGLLKINKLIKLISRP